METRIRLSLFNVIVFVVFCVSDSYCDTIKRKVHTECLQPTILPENVTFLNMFYTRANGPDDTLHYITSTYGLLSILVAKTDNGVECNINWKNFFSNNLTDVAHSITFTKSPHYVYGIQFLQLIEYDDPEDKADLDKANPNSTHKYNLSSDVPWTNSSLYSDLSKNEIVFKVNDNYTESETGETMTFLPGGSLDFKVRVSGEADRATSLPHLQQTANTTEVDVIMNHILAHYDNARYGLEISYITTNLDQVAGSIHLNTKTSIDDEHTPGVFQIIDISVNMTPTSFIQWKPVCYKSPNRAMKTATKVKNYPLSYDDNITCNVNAKRNILYAYFGEAMCSSTDYKMALFNVSFGLSQDKFYTHTNYSAWSFILGYGEVPSEKISLIIIIIISIGLGVPVLLILFGGLGALVHKKKRDDKSKNTAVN